MALDAGRLKQAARDRTGLVRFSDEPMDEGLEAFVVALNDTDATAQGLAAAEAAIVATLAERLRLDDWFARHPEVLAEEVRAPVFVVGLPRSGTTALSQFLSEDPQARSIRRWELQNATPPPDPAVADDPRIAITRAAFEARDRAMPAYRTLLPVSAEDPSEHGVLLAHSFLSLHTPMMHHAPAYLDWLLRADLRPGYAYMKKVLQLLQSKTPAPHWNLKNPMDIFGLDALVDVFPDARIVWCHRDPAASLPSNCSLLNMIRTASGEHVDKIELGRMKLETYAEGARRAMAARERLGDARFVDVFQRKLMRDTPGVIEALYGALGLPFSDDYRARLTGRVRERNETLAGKAHAYTLEEFGLTLPAIRDAFGAYTERFGVPLEA